MLLCALLLPLLMCAQKVKLAGSSSTSWSGGIAGRYGTNYNFTIEFSEYKKDEPVPDTFWIGHKCFPVILKADPVPQNYNTVRTAGKRKVSFLLIGGTDYRDDKHGQDPYNAVSKRIQMPVPPIEYKGLALLSYKYRGKRRYYMIDRIITANPPVNYP